MSMQISAPKIEDRAHWETLYYAYAEFYQVPMNEQILDKVWSWIMDANQSFYCLLAKDEDGLCVGLMHYRAMPSPLRGAMVGFLDDLFVMPKARGAGVVEALYAALNHEAKIHGWPIVRWITADNNFRARSVYDKLAQKTHWVTYQMPIAD